RTETTLTPKITEEIRARLDRLAKENFPLLLQSKVVALTLRHVSPTHVLDDVATAEARNRAEQLVPSTAGNLEKKANMTIVNAGDIKQEDWLLLKAENDAYLRSLGMVRWS
ncbi:MAG TPA: hypothetical protein VKK61_01395, partial [Tepidisphaeraceae bacterium]|nr:hypothetical protein [Tepidisphaeraceae bacterium]